LNIGYRKGLVDDMQLSRNYYKKLKQSQLFLANPNKNYIDTISCAEDMSLKIYANSLSELSFKVYEYDDIGVKNSIYDLLEVRRLVELQYIAWFQIQESNETHDENSTAMYKIIKCYTLENELIGKPIYNINGTFGLYDITDTEHSLLHIIALNCGWNIGHVDSDLLNKWRVFDLDADQIYNFLTGKVSETFECIFVFDTFTKEINAYEIENFGRLTNITISNKNILQQFQKTSDADNIVTKFRVLGGTNTYGTQFDIRAVTIDGSDSIINVDYYMDAFDPVNNRNGWMSQGLANGLQAYKAACDSYDTQFTNNLNLLKQYKSDLTTLNTELTDIKSQIASEDGVMGSIVSSYTPSRPPVVGETGYTIYQQALSDLVTLTSQKASKEAQISSKNAQIVTVETTLENISTTVDRNNFLTSAQQDELETYITSGDDYVDDTFIATDTMTDNEVIDLKLQLKSLADNKLATLSRPQYTIETTLSNLFTIMDEDYDDWQEDCEVGNLITLMFRENYWITVRLMIMEFDFNNLSEIKLTFSDKTRLDDKLTQLAETIKQSGRTSSSFSLGKYAYNAAASNTSDFLTFKNGILDATKNKLVSSENEDITFGSFGLRARQFNPNTNTYSPYQMWLTSNVMMFSSDGFSSASSAFGRLTAPDGSTVMGINTDYLIGRVVLTENLYITNTSGTYNFNKDGFTATATVGSNSYLVGINPSTPSTIFRIAVNGSNKLYVDTVNNRLNIEGYINATGGTLGNLTVTGTLTGGIISGSSISGGYISGSTITGVNISGSSLVSTGIVGGSVMTTTINNGYITTDGYILVKYSSLESKIDFSTLTFYNGGTFLAAYGTSASITGSLTVQGSSLLSSVICTSLTCTTLNGNTPITSGNINGYFPSTSGISAVVVDSAYIQFSGGRAAGHQWALNTFELKAPSDLRLKKNVKTLDTLPIELFMELKPYMYELKCNGYGNGIRFGFFSQMVESAFLRFGLNAIDYNLIEIIDSSLRTDEGEYVLDGKIHRINYENFHAWDIMVTQKLFYITQTQSDKIICLEDQLDDYNKRLSILENIIISNNF
jgi:hypothetical protein